MPSPAAAARGTKAAAREFYARTFYPPKCENIRRALKTGAPRSEEHAGPGGTSSPWLVFALGVTALISYGTTYYLFGVLVVPIEQETGWSRSLLLGAYSLALLVSGLLGVPIGRWVDRHGARALMTAGSALSGASLIWLGWMHQPWHLFLGWAVGTGLGNALTLYPVSSAVVVKRTVHGRGAALATLTLLGGMASPVCIPLAGYLVRHLGWRGTLMVMGLINLAVAVPLHWVFLGGQKHPAPAEGASGDNVNPGGDVTAQAALRTVAFWTLTGAIALVQLASRVIIVHQVAFLSVRTGDALLAASVAGLVGLASLPGRFVLNRLGDRISPQRLLAFSLTVGAVGSVVLMGVSSTASLWAYVILFGFAFGAIWPLQAAVMADQFGKRSFAAIIALQGVPVAICAASGPVTAAWIYDQSGSYLIAFALCAAAFLLAAGLVQWSPRPPIRDGGATA